MRVCTTTDLLVVADQDLAEAELHLLFVFHANTLKQGVNEDSGGYESSSSAIQFTLLAPPSVPEAVAIVRRRCWWARCAVGREKAGDSWKERC